MKESEEQYTTLFCEGDGHLGLYDQIRITFVQKEREYCRQRRAEKKLVPDYIKLHPEVVAALGGI